jgi:hypothetical protein
VVRATVGPSAAPDENARVLARAATSTTPRAVTLASAPPPGRRAGKAQRFVYALARTSPPFFIS